MNRFLCFALSRSIRSQLVHRLLGDCFAVFFVQDSEGLWKADSVDFFAQEFDAEAVKGADEVVIVAAVHHLGDAAAHFRCGFVGEGEAQQIGGVDAQDVHQIGITVRKRLGLARPGACHYTNPPLGGFHSLPLPRIQPVKNVSHICKYMLFSPYHRIFSTSTRN